MTSILTNSAAISAISILRNVNSGIDETQDRVSSGLKIATAKDGAAFWSIATTMRSDVKAMSSVVDAMNIGSAINDTAYTGLTTAYNIVDEIKSKLTAARSGGVPRDKIQKEIDALKTELQSVGSAATFNAQNWLYNSSINSNAPGTKEIAASFNRDPAGNVSIGVIGYSTFSSMLIDGFQANRGILTKGVTVTQKLTATTSTTASYYLINASSLTGASGTGGQTASMISLAANTSGYVIDAMIQAVDYMLAGMNTAATIIGSNNAAIKVQNEYAKSLQEVLTKGLGGLVDADLNEESTKLKSLQTQQQLAIQSLSIANANTQNLLPLFRQ